MVKTLKKMLKTVRISCFPVAWSLRVSVPGITSPLRSSGILGKDEYFTILLKKYKRRIGFIMQKIAKVVKFFNGREKRKLDQVTSRHEGTSFFYKGVFR